MNTTWAQTGFISEMISKGVDLDLLHPIDGTELNLYPPPIERDVCQTPF